MPVRVPSDVYLHTLTSPCTHARTHVRMCVFVRVRGTCVCARTHPPIHMHNHTHTHNLSHTHTHVRIQPFARGHAQMYLPAHIGVHACAHRCACVRSHLLTPPHPHTHARTHTHTHTHTHATHTHRHLGQMFGQQDVRAFDMLINTREQVPPTPDPPLPPQDV